MLEAINVYEKHCTKGQYLYDIDAASLQLGNEHIDFKLGGVVHCDQRSPTLVQFRSLCWGDIFRCPTCGAWKAIVHHRGFFCKGQCKRHYYSSKLPDDDLQEYDSTMRGVCEVLSSAMEATYPNREEVAEALNRANMAAVQWFMAMDIDQILDNGYVCQLVHMVGVATDGTQYDSRWEALRDKVCTLLILICRLFDGLSKDSFLELEERHYDLFKDWETHWNVDPPAHYNWPSPVLVSNPVISREDPERWEEDLDGENYTGTGEVMLKRYILYRNKSVLEYERFRDWLRQNNMSGILDMFHEYLRAEEQKGAYPCSHLSCDERGT